MLLFFHRVPIGTFNMAFDHNCFLRFETVILRL